MPGHGYAWTSDDDLVFEEVPQAGRQRCRTHQDITPGRTEYFADRGGDRHLKGRGKLPDEEARPAPKCREMTPVSAEVMPAELFHDLKGRIGKKVRW